MKVVAILFQVGAACVSPLEAAPGSLTAYKVECATIITAPEAESPSAASPAPAKPIVEEPIQAPKPKKVRTGGCKKRWYVKNGHKRYRCVR